MTRRDPAEIERLLESTSVDLLNYFLRRVSIVEDAADLLADTFLVACRRAQRVPTDPKAGRMWLFVTARHVLANWRRGQTRRAGLADTLRSELKVHSGDPGAGADCGVGLDVRNAVAALPPQQQELIRLVHWDGFTVVEAASVLGVRESTARGRYQRAKAALHTRLADYAENGTRDHPAPTGASSTIAAQLW